MKVRSHYAVTVGTAVALLSLLLPNPQTAFALPGGQIKTAQIIKLGNDQGRVDSNEELNLTVVLKMHNKADFDKAVEDIYNPKSPNYRHFMTATDLDKYAPTAAEFETVKRQLVGEGYSVVSSDPHRFSIRVHGTAGVTEKAFQTELHTFTYQGRTFQAHTTDAKLGGVAGDLVDSVAGLERHQVRPLLKVASNPRTNKPLFQKPVITADLASDIAATVNPTAISNAGTFTYKTPGASLPVGSFYGAQYSNKPNLIVSYTPQRLQAHYGLTALVGKGYDGTGQTIALVEAYGYDAAEADANAVAGVFGLPLLNSSNFSVVYPEGKPLDPDAADLTGWTTEIALDIQSAHAIAPGAKIVVVASAGQDNEDQIASLQYIIDNKVAYTASSSWENDDEIIAGPAEEEAFNTVLELGASQGISFQFSSGDGGDLGLGTPVGAVGVPSNSPWATAVGGTSFFNNPWGKTDITTGWGNNITYLNLDGPVDPPSDFTFFYAGAGGGESVYFAKPSWQSALPGTGRQVPDVSALADPFTGFMIVYTSFGTQYLVEGIGGTSLASPIFTATWAIAQQFNGGPIGHAGAIVPYLQAGQITDVLPTNGMNQYDVVGTITDSGGTTSYTAADIFGDNLYSQADFVSTIWNLDPPYESVALSFGTDSSLTVTPGWDNVTGWGEPNGLPFIRGVTGREYPAVPVVK